MDTAKFTPKLSADQYNEMSVYDLYQIMVTIVGIKQFFNLTCCSQPTGETPVFEWAEEREQEIDSELAAMAVNLAARLGLSADDEDVRDMAFARIDGYVPHGMWSDGRLQRMKLTADLRKSGA